MLSPRAKRRNVPRQQRNFNQRRIVEVLLDALGQRKIPEVQVVIVEVKTQPAKCPCQLVRQSCLA